MPDIENCLPSCKLQSPPNLELITVSMYLPENSHYLLYGICTS